MGSSKTMETFSFDVELLVLCDLYKNNLTKDFSDADILNTFKSIVPSKNPGPDEFPQNFLLILHT